MKLLHRRTNEGEGHGPRPINSKKMPEALLGKYGKSMDRIFALKISKDTDFDYGALTFGLHRRDHS